MITFSGDSNVQLLGPNVELLGLGDAIDTLLTTENTAIETVHNLVPQRWWAMMLHAAGAAFAAHRAYKDTGKTGTAVLWGAAGALFPVVTTAAVLLRGR